MNAIMMTTASTTRPTTATVRIAKSPFVGASKATFMATRKTTYITKTSRAMTVTPMAFFGSKSEATAGSLYDLQVEGIDGKKIDMKQFKGKVLLIVNLASACGFTPQYTGFVELYSKYNKKGLEILGQPCNQFGGQEPGSNADIKAFAKRKGANFNLLAKADVNGKNAAPLYAYLKSKKGNLIGSDVAWNFEKFLVDRNGEVVKRYGSIVSPEQMEKDIIALL